MTEILNHDKILSNKKYASQLSWKRSQALRYREAIKNFIDDNFNYQLPPTRKAYHAIINNINITSENKTLIQLNEKYSHLIKAYYDLADMGISIAAIFEQNGKIDTYTMGHIYAKNRIDPVWNWRKSQLIRKIYKEFLYKNPQIITEYHPVHVVLTLPHADGLYNGKEFYAAELIAAFKELRRRAWWKKHVYAGEYGIEVKPGREGQGLHIHMHSLILLKKKNVNNFRTLLKKSWHKITGATKVWAETLYLYKKDENNKYIMEWKQTDQVEGSFDENDNYVGDYKKILVRKKFYVDREARKTRKRKDISNEEKDQLIIETYLFGILECIKYHFKGDEVFQDIERLNQILENTQDKRLYSRFGQFYNEKELNFNKLYGPEEISAECREIAINTITGEELESTEVNLVSFTPNNQQRQPKTSADPYALINNKNTDIYAPISFGMSVKAFISSYLRKRFPKPELPLPEIPPDSYILEDPEPDFYDQEENEIFKILTPVF